MADEKDPIAARNNAAAKEEAESQGRSRNFTDAFDAPDRQGVVGGGKGHRAGPGEGIRAPFAHLEGGDPQISVFDGKGNEEVVVAASNREGDIAQGTGPDAESAHAEAHEGEEHPGSAFGNPSKD